MATSTAPIRKARNACDRCYELKERCTRTSTITECTRCSRLGLLCSTVRPVKPVGRRPQRRKQLRPLSEPTKSSSSQSSAAKLDHHSLDIDSTSWLREIPNLSLEEKELLKILLGRPENLDCYVVSSSFQLRGQRALIAPLPAAWPVLKDAYLACASALKLLRTGCKVIEAEKNIGLRYAASAMVTLQALPVHTAEDASLCLILGTVLALFVYSAVGVGVADICHYCLSTTRSFLDTTAKSKSGSGANTDTTSWESFLMLLEIMECIVHRRKPTLRIQLRKLDRTVDRHLGLCLPLLPYYYDLCIISHSLRSLTDTSYSVHLQTQLQGIQAAIEAWQPSQPEDFIDRFESAEIVKLLAQARVYRLAGLLVSHRLRYVFGQQDSQADIWSREIMMELELARNITKQSIRCVTLPFVVAAIEIRDPSERVNVLGNVDEYVDHFTPVIRGATKIFLERVWHERDVQITSCWLDSVYKPCVVLNAIDSACFE